MPIRYSATTQNTGPTRNSCQRGLFRVFCFRLRNFIGQTERIQQNRSGKAKDAEYMRTEKQRRKRKSLTGSQAENTVRQAEQDQIPQTGGISLLFQTGM